MLQRIDAIIFDCDGTLVDTEPIATRVLLQVLTDFGCPITKAKYEEQFVGTNLDLILSYVEREFGRALDTAAIIARYRRESAEAFEQELKPIEGMVDLVASLDIKFAVASNGPRNKMAITLPAAGYGLLISDRHIYSAYDVNKWKPDPELFLRVATDLQIDPQHCLVVEDTIHGIEAALAAQMHVVAINPRHQLEMIDELKIPTVPDGFALASYIASNYRLVTY